MSKNPFHTHVEAKLVTAPDSFENMIFFFCLQHIISI